jgi:hypothetical protein
VLLRAAWRLFEAGRVYWRLRRAGVPVVFGETVAGVAGIDRLEGVRLAPIDRSGKLDAARARSVECDRLGVCFRFNSATELSRQVGAAHEFSALGGEWIVRVDDGFRSTKRGIYAAGESTGVAGADAAMLTGAMAAHSILQDLGKNSRPERAREVTRLRKRLATEQKFTDYLRAIGSSNDPLLMAMLTDQTTVCKCQNISAGELRATLAAHPYIEDVNALKLISRVGMGLCQGRYCSSYARMILTQARGGRSAALRPFTAQVPVKPVLISQLLRVECDDV